MRVLIFIALLLLPWSRADAQTLEVGPGTLAVPSGVLDFGEGVLTLAPEGQIDESGGYIQARRFTITRPLSSPSAVNVGGLGLTVTSAQDLGSVTFVRAHVAQQSAGNTGIARYYDVAVASDGAAEATLVFAYRTAELGSINETELALSRSPDEGTTWLLAGGTVDADANTVTVAAQNTLTGRWSASSTNALLPVELVHFAAISDGDAVRLDWTTAGEQNNAGFYVERETDTSWRTEGFVAGHGTTTETQRYAHTVTGLSVGVHRFRLRQVDFDGTASFSPVVEAAVLPQERFLLTPPYPNPALSEARFTMAVRQTESVRVALYDGLGRLALLAHDGLLVEGVPHTVLLNVATLPTGMYVLRIEGASFETSRRFVIAR